VHALAETQMNALDISRFAGAQGMNAIQGASCLWVEKRKFFFESVPGHRRIHLAPGEAKWLFRQGALAIRYTCGENDGERSFEYVCSDENFSLLTLAPDARRRVRRGLEACEVKPVGFDVLASEGYAINRSVYGRQGRVVESALTDQRGWAHYMTVCSELCGLDAHGAFVDGRLIGFSIAAYVDDYCYLFHTHAYSEYMKLSPIYALTFTVMQKALARPGIRNVSQGLESFLDLPEVERFKLAMGFQKKPLGRRVEISPLARPIFSPPGAWVVGKLLKKFRPGLWHDFSAFTHALEARRSA
jgi:hypothetical protein